MRGPRGPRHRGPRAAPAVAADDRLGAPQPAAQRRDGRRAEHRRRPDVGAARGARRARRRRPSGRTRSCATTSASTARSTGEPVHDFTGVDAHLRRAAGAGPAAGRRAVVHAARPGVRPGRDGVRRTARSCPRRRTGTAGARWSRDLVGHLVDRYGLDEVRDALVVRGLERAQPRGVLVRHARGVLAAVRRDRERRAGGRRPARGRRAVDRGGGLGGRAARARRRRPARRSTSSRRTPTATRRWTCGRRSRGTAARTPQIWWTEWGVSPTHFGNANDGVFSAAFLARGMRSAAGRIEALSYWVVSDQFEELGRPPRLLHGGFGLRTVGELRKPRWWALWLLEQLGRDEVAATVTGDGADSLVEVWASRDDDRRRGRAVERHPGPVQGRRVRRAGPHGAPGAGRAPAGAWTVRESRVDADHSNIAAVWSSMSDGADWPTDEQWATLRAADRLAVTERPLDGSVAGRRPAQPGDRAGRAGSRVSLVVAQRRRLPGLRPLVPGRRRRRRR